jgi:hypothetical protein
LSKLPQGRSALFLILFLFVCCHLALAQEDHAKIAAPEVIAPTMLASESALPDAPASQATGSTLAAPSAPEVYPHRYAQVIEPEWTTQVLTPGQKMIFSMRENVRLITLFPALYSAGYEQLTGSDPKYGSDSGAGAMKFGAAMAHSASVRLFSDGVFAPVFHQDPRYYRMAHGSFWHRSIYSAERALVRRSDDGSLQINSSGLSGRAAAAVLVLAYYPPASRSTDVVLTTFGFSVLTDAGGNLVLEFWPDLARKFPILKKFEIE